MDTWLNKKLIKTLHEHAFTDTGWIDDLLSGDTFWLPFNPCLKLLGADAIMAFRSSVEPGGKVRSYLAYRSQGDVSVLDLSDYCAKMGIGNVADPKLFEFQGGIWVTFNTGWSPEGNELYVMRITPNLGLPMRCELEGRQRIEKNWAFYDAEGSLRALYALGNGSFLEALDGDWEIDNVVRMRFCGRHKVTRANDFSIGSQFCLIDGEAYFMSHKKIQILGRRLYLGVLSKISEYQGVGNVSFGKNYFCHSFRSMIGSDIKRNKNLISCTYFSGLEKVEDSLLLSYGINDIGYGLATLRMEDLF